MKPPITLCARLRGAAAILLCSTLLTAAGQAGTLDSDFNGDGLVSTAPFVLNPGSTMAIADMALQSNGRIVVVGTINRMEEEPRLNDMVVARYMPDGTLDLSFGGGDGYRIFDLGNGHDNASAVAIQEDGRIIVVGSGSYDPVNNSQDMVIKRLLADGTTDVLFAADNIFDLNGTRTIDLGGTAQGGYGVLLRADGRIVVMGNTNSVAQSEILLAQLLPGGAFDESFSYDGLQTTAFGAGISMGARAFVDLPEGKLIVAGTLGEDVGLVRYNADGSVDLSFSGDGRSLIPSPQPPFNQVSNVNVKAMVVDAQLRTIIVGTITNTDLLHPATSNSTAFVLRCLPDGTADATFGYNGWAEVHLGSGGDVHVASDGTLLVAGTTNHAPTNMRVTRLSSTGSVDVTFATNGMALVDFANASDHASCMLVQPDGRILLGGATDYNGDQRNQFALARLLNDADISVAEFEWDPKVSIHPNPVEHALRIDYDVSIGGAMTCEVLDMQGRVVRTVFSHAYRPAGQQYEVFDVHDLSAGLYNVRLTNGGAAFTQRFAKH